LSIKEEDLMGLYAIAKDEIDGVNESCERLNRVVARLDSVSVNIQLNAKSGVEGVLSDFEGKVSSEVRESILNASIGLKNAVSEAEYRLYNIEFYKVMGIFALGMMCGFLLFWFFWKENMSDLAVGQEAIYKEIQSIKVIKVPVKVQKAKVKRGKKAATQKSEDGESGTSSAGGEEESQ
jgi:hypothetical protein